MFRTIFFDILNNYYGNTAAFLGKLIPEDVLYYYDGPRAFTARSSKNHLLFVFWVDELEKGDRYVVSPISLKTLQELRNNQLAVRDVFSSGFLWLVDQAFDERLTRVELVTIDEIDQRFPNSLPAPELCLQPK